MTQVPDPMEVALARIATERVARTGCLDLTDLALTTIPDEIFGLTHLRQLSLRRSDENYSGPDGLSIWIVQDKIGSLSSLEIIEIAWSDLSDLGFVSALPRLQQLDCSGTPVSDLTPLAALARLQQLDCSGTPVSDLTPLAALARLQQLDCSLTPVSDLAPLAGLAGLQQLDCSGTPISDLTPLAGLASLQQLDCTRTPVSDLTPLAGLAGLQQLDCTRTQVSDLAPLAGLASLQQLDCAGTPVSDLAPLAGLAGLQQLDCAETQVSDLAPLAGLASLQQLDCAETSVSDLAPLAGLASLQQLDCSYCKLDDWPTSLLNLPSLSRVILHDAHAPDLPREVLSRGYGENCLHRLRAHFADLAIAATSVPDIRVLLVGNGCVGKTQIANWLAGKPFDQEWDSTHGIRIETVTLPGGAETRLHLWDFGGQDIYHSTHSLFLRHPTVLMPVWAQDRETLDEYPHQGLTFRNHPLAYWIDVLRQQADPDSPVLILQNKCERAGKGARSLQISDEAIASLRYVEKLQVSARTRRGEAAFKAYLAEAIEWLRDPARLGTPRIGAGRLRVQRRIEAIQAENLALPAAQRQRFLEREAFEAFCAEEGGVSSPGMLLDYLAANGTVFHRPGLFRDRIVLDQAWALEAIYALFDRNNSVYRVVRGNGGRFTLAMLGEMVWQDHEYGEQKLFLDMMRSCGICFDYRAGGPDGEDWLIAPDLLPERAAVALELDSRWDADARCAEARFAYALLPGGLIRAVMAEIGAEAGLSALYWRGGFCGFEATTRSHFLIEEVKGAAWDGSLRIATRGSQAPLLLDRLAEIVEQAQDRLGLRPVTVERPTAGGGAPDASLDFKTPEKPPMPKWFVSYAWKDDKSDEGRAREDKVDAFCAEAATRGHRVERDKTDIALGDSISAFMRRLGAADRIFVFLSDRYLKSPACLFELYAIWRRAQQEPEAFLDRVRVFTQDGADVWSPIGRTRYALHWKKQREELEALLREAGTPDVLGPRDFAALKRMQEFQSHVGEILAMLADIRQPRTLDELFEYGFD